MTEATALNERFCKQTFNCYNKKC